MGLLSRRRRNGSACRGAVALETVVVLPLLLLVAFATIELGGAWHRSREVNNASRSAARIASNLSNTRFADYEALLTLQAGVQDLGSIKAVVIFKATSVDGKVPDECKTTDVSNLCNHYTALEMQNLSSSQFSNLSSCTGAPDAAWCPLSRENDPKSNPDYIGIWVRIEQEPITGIFPGADSLLVIEDTTVMRAEPEVIL